MSSMSVTCVQMKVLKCPIFVQPGGDLIIYGSIPDPSQDVTNKLYWNSSSHLPTWKRELLPAGQNRCLARMFSQREPWKHSAVWS